MNKASSRMAGKALNAFLDALGGAAATKATDFVASKIFDSEKLSDMATEDNLRGTVLRNAPGFAGEAAKYGAPIATAAVGGALLAGGTALVQGLTQGEKPRSDYALPIGGPMDQLYLRQEGTAASIDQKLAADLMRTEAHAQLADRKFRHQMALQQHRQDAMVPRNQPMEGGVDVSRMLNGYTSNLFSTHQY
jgi:hypothetical protein